MSLISKFIYLAQNKKKRRGVIDCALLLDKYLFISGWACDLTHPDDQQQLDIYAGNHLITTLQCEIFRQDLKELGYGRGRHGFSLNIDTNTFDKSFLTVLKVKFHDSRVKLDDSKL